MSSMIPASMALALVTLSGCIGFLNGYIADSRPMADGRHIQDTTFSAVSSDIALMQQNHQSDLGPIRKGAFDTICLADLPISACADTLFLPVKGTAWLIHGTKTNAATVQPDARIHATNCANTELQQALHY